MAKRLKQNTRQSDFVARLSGDEFAIIVQSVQHVENLILIAENLIKCCEQPLHYKDQDVHFRTEFLQSDFVQVRRSE